MTNFQISVLCLIATLAIYFANKRLYRRFHALPLMPLVFTPILLVLILVVVWYGIRHTLLNPLSRVIAHIREIASGNLTATLAVSGRNEIGELASTVDHMQR